MTQFEAELPDALDGERVDRVVSMLCDLPRSTAGSLVDAGRVEVDGSVVTRRATRLGAGQSIRLDLPDPVVAEEVEADRAVDFPVVYEDDYLIVIDKPAGLVVHPGAGNPTGTLVHGLLARYPDIASVGEADRPGIVHRLDRDTSGLMVVALDDTSLSRLQAAIGDRRVSRQYRTLAWGHVTDPRGLIDAPIGRSRSDPTRMAVVVGGREARTAYEVVHRYDQPVEVTELVCTLETGRTHQIRVHLQGLGHPVVGDPRYGGARESLPVDRQFLHAQHLAFTHPVTGEALEFHSALPGDLRAVLNRLS